MTRSLNPGGSERQLTTLACGLCRRGHQIEVIAFYSGGLLEAELRSAGVQVETLAKRGRWDVFGFLWRLIHAIGRDRPEILHGYLGVPNLLVLLLSLIFPRMRAVWGVRASTIDFDHYDWLTAFLCKVECQVSRYADLIIVNSQAGFDHAAASGFPVAKMVMIPNGIDTERFRPDREARLRARAEWGIGEDEQLIGLVGRLDPMKDHPTFLSMAALLARQSASVKFVCVGDGPETYKQKMIELGDELGLSDRLVWAGLREDMAAVYNALDLLTLTSTGEGFPNVIGEAMACGVPCVATDVGDAAQIIGETGVVAPEGDAKALALGCNRLLYLASFEQLALKDKARKRIEENFSLNNLIIATEMRITERLCLAENGNVEVSTVAHTPQCNVSHE